MYLGLLASPYFTQADIHLLRCIEDKILMRESNDRRLENEVFLGNLRAFLVHSTGLLVFNRMSGFYLLKCAGFVAYTLNRRSPSSKFVTLIEQVQTITKLTIDPNMYGHQRAARNITVYIGIHLLRSILRPSYAQLLTQAYKDIVNKCIPGEALETDIHRRMNADLDDELKLSEFLADMAECISQQISERAYSAVDADIIDFESSGITSMAPSTRIEITSNDWAMAAALLAN